MSIASNPTGARDLSLAMGPQLDKGGQADGSLPAPLSPRQMELDHLWRYYRCANYDARRLDWSGKQNLSKVEHEQVAQAGFIPPGFYDAGNDVPLKFRRPTAPYYLGKVIVDRFTSLLFSNRRNPKIVVEGDPDTQDYVTAMAEVSRLWPALIQARAYGGAMGSVGMGFKFFQGKPVVEVHDPRWSTPTFADAYTGRLAAFDKRYTYRDYIRGPKGEWVAAWFWYRRYIDAEVDLTWPKVPVGMADEEPAWERFPPTGDEHGLGFCPVVWVQNLPVQDDIDGDPDALGAFDLIEAIDTLVAQAHKGTVNNCDPTVSLATDAEFGEVMKGSDNAILLEKGGTAGYMEISGSGPRVAMELVAMLEERALRLVRCYLDSNKDGPAKTMTEIERNYSSMLEKCDVLREQYGERGVKPLLEMMLAAARGLSQPRIVRGSGPARVERPLIRLPKKALKETADGRATFVERKLGPSDQVDLKWPPYFTPSLDDAVKAVQAAAMALTTHIVDDEHAAQFVAPYFQIEDVPGLLEKLRDQAKSVGEDVMETQLANRMTAGMTPNLKP